jgi:hypothetical protein
MEAPHARRALLTRLFDHAPMFPPASLPAEDALVEDGHAATSRHAFLLGRLVWPASAAVLPEPGRALSLVLDADAPEGVSADALELRYRDGLASLVGLADDVYVEVPLDQELDSRLDELAALGLRAKVRCGGAQVPSAASLARFVRACRERRVAFKATAGLHHALPTGGEHGFLNLLAATVFAGDEESALAESDPAAFRVTEEAFAWRARSASRAELARVRSEDFHAIGSCSFFEPVDELEALGVLPL